MSLDPLTEIPQGCLSALLAAGPVVEAEALGYAIDIAADLKRVHESGHVAGDLSPERIRLAGPHASLSELPKDADPGPYSAPERWLGKAADRRSDIFSFGALLYHMIAGLPPFAAAEGADLREALLACLPAPIDGPGGELRAGLARIAAACMAKTPERRCQRIQHALLELKLLQASVRQADFRAQDRREHLENLLRAEVAGLTAAVVPRMDGLEEQMAEMRQAVEAAVTQVKAAIRIQGALADDLSSHASSIGSLETAVCQTDDTVEHLVEAFDSLQSLILERSDRQRAAVGTNGTCPM